MLADTVKKVRVVDELGDFDVRVLLAEKLVDPLFPLSDAFVDDVLQSCAVLVTAPVGRLGIQCHVMDAVECLHFWHLCIAGVSSVR